MDTYEERHLPQGHRSVTYLCLDADPNLLLMPMTRLFASPNMASSTWTAVIGRTVSDFWSPAHRHHLGRPTWGFLPKEPYFYKFHEHKQENLGLITSNPKNNKGSELTIDKLWYVSLYYLKTIFPKHRITESKDIKMLKKLLVYFSKGYMSLYVHEHNIQITI